MNLGPYAGGGRVLTVRAPRHRVDVVLGWLAPVALALAAVIVVGGPVLGAARGHLPAGLVLGLVLGSVTAFLLIVPAYSIAAGRAARTGTDRTAGLPLAELSDDGVRARYRAPTFRERRTGRPADPAFDVAAPWDAIIGWRDGTDPNGQPVVVLDAIDVTARAADPGTVRYVAALRNATGSPLVVRLPPMIAAQGDAVRDALENRWHVPRHG